MHYNDAQKPQGTLVLRPLNSFTNYLVLLIVYTGCKNFNKDCKNFWIRINPHRKQSFSDDRKF